MPTTLRKHLQFFWPLLLPGFALVACAMVPVVTLFSTPYYDDIPHPFPTATTPSKHPDTWNPPIYPVSHNVNTFDTVHRQWLGLIKTTSFSTTNSPDAVRAWYNTEMERVGWLKSNQSTDNALVYMVFDSCGSHGCWVYVDISPTYNN